MTTPLDVKRLLNAFVALGGDKNGFIDYSKLETLFKNEKKLSGEEISTLLESNSCQTGKKLNFVKLIANIAATKNALENINPEEVTQSTACTKKINSRTFTRRKGSGRASSLSHGKKSQELGASQDLQASLKGCVFDAEESILSAHRYLLEISENSPIEIVAQAIDARGFCNPIPAIEILLFLENDGPNKKLVTFSSFINSQGYCTIKMNLKKGKYLLVPVTLNWRGEAQDDDDVEIDPLTDFNESGEIVLTPECHNTLKTIFDLIDLDRNGLLSEQEFCFFIQYVCGEAPTDEWSTVEDNFDTVGGQLTFDGFLSLYKMAIVTDSQDVIQMFKKMGLDNYMQLQKALPFLLTVNAKATVPKLQPLPVCIFDSLMEEVFRKTAIEQGHCSKIASMNDLLLYIHKLSQRVTIVVLNKSHSKVKVRLDCQNSENCISHQKSLDYVAEVQPRTSIIGHHLFPEQCGISWSIHCIESLV